MNTKEKQFSKLVEYCYNVWGDDQEIIDILDYIYDTMHKIEKSLSDILFEMIIDSGLTRIDRASKYYIALHSMYNYLTSLDIKEDIENAKKHN